MLNSVSLIGRLGKDPELAYTPSGKAVTKFTLATSTKSKDNEYTEWHNITAWNKTAESAKEYLKKGHLCHVEGSLHYSNYTGKDNVKKYFTEITARRIIFLESRPKSAENASLPQGTSDNSSEEDDLPF